MTVFLRWGSKISEKICVKQGTKQGGLTSPLLFNLLYPDLVIKIQLNKCGVRLGCKYFNCFSYADYPLLCSLFVSCLQSMINTCVNYVNSHGLRFNPLKTTCFIIDNNPKHVSIVF